MSVVLVLSIALAADPSALAAKGKPPSRLIDFVRDIQPILKAHCYECHGPETQESGLRLDVRARALEGGDHGPLLVANKSTDSELVRRVISTDDEKRMPPDGERLSQKQITLLRKWIDSGANWPDDGLRPKRKHSDHWSFQLPKRLSPPVVKDAKWIRNEIDRFVLAKLESKRIAPSPQADRNTLFRRLCLDLVGLPPTPAQLEAFLSDIRPDAYGRAVDRLLSSKHFGERWGRHWLDLARYADSNGYERDDVRPNAWRYRDWVIGAVNRNMPYDRFVIEQIAGDLLPDADIAQKTATGFHRMAIKNTESGINKEDYRNREVVDRVNTTGTVFLGLTVGCGQCHSHKYDPISQREYYRFYAFFNNMQEVDIDIKGTIDEQQDFQRATDAFQKRSRSMKRRLQLLSAMLKGGVEKWRSEVPRTNARHEKQIAAQTKLLSFEPDERQQHLTPELLAALRLPDDVQKALKIEKTERNKKQAKLLADYFSSLDKKNTEIKNKIRSVDQHLQDLNDSAEVVAALKTDSEHRSKSQQVLVKRFETVLKSRVDDLKKEVRMLGVEKRYLPKPYVMTSAENRDKRRTTHVLLRGEFKQKGPQVHTDTFGVLNKLKPRGKAADRLDLARWLVDSKNPLTARVAVNHVWKHLFGRGLVATVDDFGSQGERPSHPVLLDWLAVEFREQGWSRKRLIRLIVTSAVYRQSSVSRPDLAEVDPLNTLLARQSRFRVEGEIIRDLFLTAAGLLDRTVGGKTIRPPVPDSIRDLAFKYKLVWNVSDRPDRYRRGMYIHFKRSNPFPSLMAFDVPESNLCAARRNRSNTPLQALTTLNDPVFVECAQALARRILEDGPEGTEARVRYLGQVCLSRNLESPEIETLTQLFRAERSAYREDPQASAAFVGAYRAPGHPDFETAGWVAVARAVMNLDQFVTRE